MAEKKSLNELLNNVDINEGDIVKLSFKDTNIKVVGFVDFMNYNIRKISESCGLKSFDIATRYPLGERVGRVSIPKGTYTDKVFGNEVSFEVSSYEIIESAKQGEQ